MWRFLSLPVTTVIGRCTLDLPQMTVLDLRKAHDRFLLANPRVTSTIDPPTPGLETLSIAYKFVLFIYYILHYNCR